MDRLLNCPLEIYVGIENDAWRGNPLAYVTYKKPTGEIAKEWSFTNWCSKAEKKTFKNEPVEGFKVITNVGGSGGGGFDKRKAWFQILDPRGFRFEISADNFMDIIRKHDICKGVIQGQFAYAWDESVLLLISTNSNDWKNGITSAINTASSEKITGTNIVVGHGYCLRDHNIGYYLGRFKWHSYNEKDTSYGDRIRYHKLETTTMYTFLGKYDKKTVIIGYKDIKHVKFDTGKTIGQDIIDLCIDEFNNSNVSKPVSSLEFNLRKKCTDTWRDKKDVDFDNASYEEWIKFPVRHPNERYDCKNFKILGENRLDIIRSFKFPNGNIRNYLFETISLGKDCIIDNWYIESTVDSSHFRYEAYLKNGIKEWDGDVSQLMPTYGEDPDMFKVCTKVDDELERVPMYLSKTYETITIKNKNIKF